MKTCIDVACRGHCKLSSRATKAIDQPPIHLPRCIQKELNARDLRLHQAADHLDASAGDTKSKPYGGDRLLSNAGARGKLCSPYEVARPQPSTG